MDEPGKKDKIFDSSDRLDRDFTFDERTAEVFDDMVSRSVPLYPELQKMLVQLGSRFAQGGSKIYDLGCATGTTLLGLAKRVPESVNLIGVDLSKPMLEETAKKLRKYGLSERCELRQGDVNDQQDLKDASVVIMAWTLQFVRPMRRDALIRNIHLNLRPNGALILTEKVLGPDAALNRLYIDLYLDYKREQGYSELEIAKKREALENVLIPYRVDENVELLQRNGFRLVDVFFRWFNWSGILAVKG